MQDQKEEWVQKAREHYAKREYAETIFYCDEVLTHHPKNIPILQLRVKAAQAQAEQPPATQSRYIETIAFCDRILAVTPMDYQKLVERGIAKQQLGLYEEAILDFEKVRDLESVEETKKLKQMRSFVQKKQWETLEKVCAELSKSSPRNIRVWWYKYLAAAGMKKYSDSLKSLKEVLELDPYYPIEKEFFNKVKDKLIEEGDTCKGTIEEALSCYETVLSMNLERRVGGFFGPPEPYEPGALLGRAYLYTLLGHFTDAWNIYENIIAIDPNNKKAWIGKGDVSRSQKKYDEAMLFYEVYCDPNDSFHLSKMGVALFCSGKFSAAFEYFEKACLKNPDELFALQGKAMCLVQENSLQEASSLFQHVNLRLQQVVSTAHKVDLWFCRGHMYLSLKDYIHAEDAFKQVQLLHPENEKAKLYIYVSSHSLAAPEQSSLSTEVASLPLAYGSLPNDPELIFILSQINDTLTKVNGVFAKIATIRSSSDVEARVSLSVPREPRFVEYEKIKKEKELIGSSTLHVIYKATWDGEIIALKILKVSADSEENRKQIESEFNKLKSIDCSQIIKTYGFSYDQEQNYCLMLHYYPKGNLGEYVYDPKELHPKAWRYQCAIEVCEALDYLHSRRWVHKDIKPENVFLDENWHAVLGDFGLSDILPDNSTHQSTDSGGRGTYAFMAPELLQIPADGQRNAYRSSCDIYSLGIFLWCCEVQKKPFEKLNGGQIAVHVTKGERAKIPPETSPKLAALIQSCWAQDPRKRPVILEVFKKMTDIYTEELQNSGGIVSRPRSSRK